MLHTTKAIVLRSIKYGDTSLISTLFTERLGVQTYIVQGVRSNKAKLNKAALLQPATLLDIVVYQKPNINLQRIKELQFAHLYNSMQQEVVKNSIALFSIELLLRLLPEHAQQQDLFDFSYKYFMLLDVVAVKDTANFPLYFTIQCSRLLGYEVRGSYTASTPYINMQEGAFTNKAPALEHYLNDSDTAALNLLLEAEEIEQFKTISINAEIRNRLLDWYIEFLHQHTQHLGTIKSLSVLRTILH